MGKTERVVPGSWNFAVLVAAVSAAEVALAASQTAVPDARLSVATSEEAMVVKPFKLVNVCLVI